MKPKFTIRHMLWATLAFGFLALAMSAAYQGNIVAMGIVIAPLVMTTTLAVLAAVYWPCYWASRLLYPPIHTPPPADFSKGHSQLHSESADASGTNSNPRRGDDESPTGAAE